MIDKGKSVRYRFEQEVMQGKDYRVITVAVRLPNGAIETITNYEGIYDKIRYYMDMYDEEFKLKANDSIQIAGFMLV